MKKSNLIYCCLAVFVTGCALGYCVGYQRAFNKIGDDMRSDNFSGGQNNAQVVAREYVYTLQKLDSGRAEDIADLRTHALVFLRVYFQGVQNARNAGYNWTPNSVILSNVTTYLAEYPNKK